ncbi:hypothetical protein ONE63_002536 [Megalurothrips usitatus]|uniref:Nose resistant-to-fluoxetine protein N-terminal domain-containing protein n=1 Tax=Megalurothrips usitatus TaxID=439358 RepID=A0AAV7XBG4_9NEOP|nr:hypothetical protein ONE63_002536 [Megalurothrips usitatus]
MAPGLFVVVLAAQVLAGLSDAVPRPGSRFRELVDIMIQPFAPATPQVSLTCQEQSRIYLQSLQKFTPWAMHMYDSGSKIPASLLSGNNMQLGNFDQCLSVRAGAAAETGGFGGRYCLAAVYFHPPPRWGQSAIGDLLLAATNASTAPEPVGIFMWSYCVPSSCSARDVEVSLRARVASVVVPPMPRPIVSVPEGNCWSADGESAPLSTLDLAFLYFLLGTIILMTASTIYDLTCSAKAGSFAAHSLRLIPGSGALLTSFSLRRNGDALLSTPRPEGAIRCMDGLRVITMAWVVLFHTHTEHTRAASINKDAINKLRQSWPALAVMNGTLATDTFLLLSGALTVTSFFRSSARHGSSPGSSLLGLLGLYWRRYVRLTPVYAICVWFYATLLVRLAQGPLWRTVVGWESGQCAANWWKNLVYINTFFPSEDMCMAHAWYLSVDMQLHWLSPLLLFPLRHWPRFTCVLMTILILAAMAVPFGITLVEGLAGTVLFDSDMSDRVAELLYTRVYARAGPFLVGMALGWLLRRELRPPRVVVVLGWAAAAVSSGAVVFGAFGVLQPGTAAAVYAGVHRSAWAAAVAWVVWACATGRGAAVNAFLAWPAFAPLARLTYCVYLTHYVLLYVYFYGVRRTPGSVNMYLVVRRIKCGAEATSRNYASVVRNLCHSVRSALLFR